MATPVQAVDRAMTVLEVFAGHSRPLSIDEVAGSTRLPRATAHRLILTLESGNYLHRSGKKFRLGHRVLGLGFGRLESTDLGRCSQPVLDSLTQQTNETSILTTRQGSGQSLGRSTGETATGETATGETATGEMAISTTTPSGQTAATPPLTLAAAHQSFRVAAVANAHQTLTVAVRAGQVLDLTSGLVAPLLDAPIRHAAALKESAPNTTTPNTPALHDGTSTEAEFEPHVGFHDQTRSVRVIAVRIRPWPKEQWCSLGIAAPASRWTESELLDRYGEQLLRHARLLGS